MNVKHGEWEVVVLTVMASLMDQSPYGTPAMSIPRIKLKPGNSKKLKRKKKVTISHLRSEAE